MNHKKMSVEEREKDLIFLLSIKMKFIFVLVAFCLTELIESKDYDVKRKVINTPVNRLFLYEIHLFK